MKLMQRRAMTAVALALGSVSAPSLSEAQSVRRNVPGADTPRLLVAVCSTSERALGWQIADAIRSRMSSTQNPRQLYTIPKEGIVSFLESSGYKPDSALGLTDLKELAKGLRADDIVGCHHSRTASGAHHIEPRLMWAVDPAMGQPLPVIETTSLTDAARQIERSVLEARKQMTDFKACRSHISGGSIDKAIASAKAGIAKYANSTIARNCLANAYRENKWPDSVLKVTDEIRKIDPKNSFATQMQFFAYRDKADAEKDSTKQEQYREQSVRVLVELLATDPGNPTLTNSVVQELGKLGRPAVALPIIDTLLTRSPGDPLLLRQKWFMTGAAAQAADSAGRPEAFAKALAAGEEMIKSDPALADSMYYARQVAAATLVSPQKAIEYLSKAVQKYPTNQDYWWYKARQEERAGQIQAAQQSMARLLALNPKYPSATVMMGQLFLAQNMTDSAIAITRRAVAAGEDRKTWGTFLLRPTQEAVTKAQVTEAEANKDSTNAQKAAQSLADWEGALALSQETDKLSPSQTSKFFVGISAFKVGFDAINKAQKEAPKTIPKAGAPKSCAHAKRAQEMFLLVQINMMQGAAIQPASATQILGYVNQAAPATDQMVRQYCKS